MADPPLVAGIFDARDIASMTAAFDAAMLIACDEGSPFLLIPECDLRAWIARCILTGMRGGNRDAHQLVALTLRDLHHLLSDRDEAPSLRVEAASLL